MSTDRPFPQHQSVSELAIQRNQITPDPFGCLILDIGGKNLRWVDKLRKGLCVRGRGRKTLRLRWYRRAVVYLTRSALRRSCRTLLVVFRRGRLSVRQRGGKLRVVVIERSRCLRLGRDPLGPSRLLRFFLSFTSRSLRSIASVSPQRGVSGVFGLLFTRSRFNWLLFSAFGTMIEEPTRKKSRGPTSEELENTRSWQRNERRG